MFGDLGGSLTRCTGLSASADLLVLQCEGHCCCCDFALTFGMNVRAKLLKNLKKIDKQLFTVVNRVVIYSLVQLQTNAALSMLLFCIKQNIKLNCMYFVGFLL